MITPEFFRLAQLLSPLSGQSNDGPRVPDYDPAARMNSLYSPEHSASDRLNQLITGMPQRQEPGLIRKVIAGISGLSGNPNMVEHALYPGYERDISDWQMKLNPAVQAANFERSGNINERSMANNIVSQELRDRNLDRQVKEGNTREKQGQERIDQGNVRLAQANERLKIQQGLAKGGQLKTDDSGKSFIVYKDGSTTPVNLDMLSAEEKQQFALERIKTTNVGKAGARDRVKTMEIDDPDNPGKKIVVSIDLDTQTATPVKMGDKTVTPTDKTNETQKATGRLERARKIKLSNPRISPYITIKGKDFEIKPPNRFWAGGISKEEYDKAFKDIYGDETPSNSNGPMTGQSSDVRINVMKDGKKYSLPASQKDQAISQGYKVVP